LGRIGGLIMVENEIDDVGLKDHIISLSPWKDTDIPKYKDLVESDEAHED
jgi:hypothetical protein